MTKNLTILLILCAFQLSFVFGQVEDSNKSDFFKLESPSNTLYLSIHNPFTLINNEDISDYEYNCNNCTIFNNAIHPLSKGEVSLVIYELKDGDTIVHYNNKFIAISIEQPVIGLHGRKMPEFVTIKSLLLADKLNLVFPNCDLDIKIPRVASFKLSCPSRNAEFTSNSDNFTLEMKKFFTTLIRGDRIYFRDIKVQADNKRIINWNSVSVLIQ